MRRAGRGRIDMAGTFFARTTLSGTRGSALRWRPPWSTPRSR